MSLNDIIATVMREIQPPFAQTWSNFYFVLPVLNENNIQLSPEGEVNRWIHTERRSIKVYIHCSSPTLRGIVVLVFTKSDG